MKHQSWQKYVKVCFRHFIYGSPLQSKVLLVSKYALCDKFSFQEPHFCSLHPQQSQSIHNFCYYSDSYDFPLFNGNLSHLYVFVLPNRFLKWCNFPQKAKRKVTNGKAIFFIFHLHCLPSFSLSMCTVRNEDLEKTCGVFMVLFYRWCKWKWHTCFTVFFYKMFTYDPRKEM